MIKSQTNILKFTAKILLFSFVVSILVFSLMYKSQIKAAMSTNHLLPEPENLTELYFNDHINLPKLIAKHAKYSFSFTIHNLENIKTKYLYSVYILTDNKKIELNSGSVDMDNNEYISIKTEFGPLKNVRMKIVVDLIGRNQQIAFWMDKL